MAKKRGAGAGAGPFVIRENKTKGYLTMGPQGFHLQPLKSGALQFAIEDQARAVAAVQLVNNYTVGSA